MVVQASIGGRVEQYSEWDATLATTAEGKNKLAADAGADLAAATGLPGATTPHDPKVTNEPLVCVGGSKSTCNKAGIGAGVSGAYANSIDTSHKLLQYKLLPTSELLDNFDTTIKLALEQATQYYIQERQQEWSKYYSKYQQCVAPFNCPHCPLGSSICGPKVRIV